MPIKSILSEVIRRAEISATQGSADAFATTVVSTGISTTGNFGWLLKRIEFEVDPDIIVVAPQTADCSLQLQVAAGVQTNLVLPNSNDFVAQMQMCMPGIAASTSAYQLPTQYVWEAPDNLVLVDPDLTLILDSTGTGAANVGTARIYYFPIELNELDILRLIAG
jgi:hypothetical protein